MSRGDYLKMFNEDTDYFTGYFSNEKLNDLSDDDIAAVVTEKDFNKVVTQMQVSMLEFVKVFKMLGIVIFLLIMYILTKQIIERNSKSISMTKILGFSDIYYYDVDCCCAVAFDKYSAYIRCASLVF